MSIIPEDLEVNRTYSRPELADLWGYKSFNAISRGVFSPKEQRVLVFFVTKEKQEALTQYEDHIDADVLFWEGEQQHGNDQRIVSRADTILVFYRSRHHTDFTYRGRASLETYRLYNDRPSKFSFRLIDQANEYQDFFAETPLEYGTEETERTAIVQSRLGQGIYRKKAIALWNSCSVTGFTRDSVLVASHIKPWRLASNHERLDPHNSLLLVPTLDKLFDRGFIGFELTGRICLSDKVSSSEWAKIGVHEGLGLRTVPESTRPYLAYHSEYIFDMVES